MLIYEEGYSTPEFMFQPPTRHLKNPYSINEELKQIEDSTDKYSNLCFRLMAYRQVVAEGQRIDT